MDGNRRKELKQQYRDTGTDAGVYAIRNTANGKVFVAATSNLKTLNGQRMQLDTGTHRCKPLVAEWKQFGASAFSFEVLEMLEKKTDPGFDEEDALQELERKWLEKLQPHGERGYH